MTLFSAYDLWTGEIHQHVYSRTIRSESARLGDYEHGWIGFDVGYM